MFIFTLVVLFCYILHRHTINDEHKQKLTAALKPFVGHFGSIWGNHDILNMNMDSARKGTVKLLADLDLLVMHTEAFEMEGVLIDVIPLTINPKVPALNPTRDSILLGHFFYEYPMDPKMSVTAEQLTNCGYTYMVLGHDHEPHAPVVSGHTTLLRPGALGRNTSHQYNLERQPQLIQFTLAAGKIQKVDFLEIPAPPPQEIFHAEAFVKSTGSSAFVANIEELLTHFTRASSRESNVTIQSALAELKTPEPAMLYIKSLHEKRGLPF